MENGEVGIWWRWLQAQARPGEGDVYTETQRMGGRGGRARNAVPGGGTGCAEARGNRLWADMEPAFCTMNVCPFGSSSAWPGGAQRST